MSDNYQTGSEKNDDENNMSGSEEIQNNPGNIEDIDRYEKVQLILKVKELEGANKQQALKIEKLESRNKDLESELSFYKAQGENTDMHKIGQ